MRDGFTCDASLMVENETLRMEVNELTPAFGNAYGGEARLLKCLGSDEILTYAYVKPRHQGFPTNGPPTDPSMIT